MEKNIKKVITLSLLVGLFSGHLMTSALGFYAYAESDAVNVMSQYFDEKDVEKWEQDIENKTATEAVQPDLKDFSRNPIGTWSWRDGVICISSSSTSGFNHGHAGLVAVEPYYYATVEANPIGGVQIAYGAWTTRMRNEKVWQIGVKRTSEAQDRQAAQWAVDRLKKPYNFNFLDIHTRESFYCSQLVWAAYKDTANVDIGTWAWGPIIHPYELIDSSETAVIFRNH